MKSSRVFLRMLSKSKMLYTHPRAQQYSQRTVPGYLQSLGTASANATVTLWSSDGSSASSQRKGNYFRAELPEDNTSAAHWLALTNLAVLNNGTNADIVATSLGHQFLPQTPEHFTYDADGNLTQDGQWNYTWDAENRLVKLAPSTTAGPQISLAFEYDWQGRRIHKQVWPNTNWTGTPTNDVKFVYDGWNLIGILNSSFTLQTSFVWGSDLSGSIRGAGGVGGLLFICDQPSAIGYSAPAYDGNGNVMALVSMSGGTNCAAYEYGPFGEVIRATGPMSKANPFRFSTKHQDDETDLLYYGYRYYSSSIGKWLSRDPIAEEDAENLYEFVGYSTINRQDYIGLLSIDKKTKTITLTNCEIAIVYGHGNQQKKGRWKWKYTDADCSAGAAVMCFPLANMESLPDSMRLWTTWGGLPLENPDGDGGRKPWNRVFWGMDKNGDDWYDWLGANMPNANKALYNVGLDAITRATEICKKKKCGCTKVTIYFIQVGHDGYPKEPPKAYDGVPVIENVTIDCGCK
jgi:RHS repeat-associated protein